MRATFFADLIPGDYLVLSKFFWTVSLTIWAALVLLAHVFRTKDKSQIVSQKALWCIMTLSVI